MSRTNDQRQRCKCSTNGYHDCCNPLFDAALFSICPLTEICSGPRMPAKAHLLRFSHVENQVEAERKIAKPHNSSTLALYALALTDPQQLPISFPDYHYCCPCAGTLHQMARQQEICNPFFHCVLMPTASTHQFSFLDACLQEHTMQVLRRLRRLFVHLCARCRGLCSIRC